MNPGANDTNDSNSNSSSDRNAVTLQDLKLAMEDLKQQALQLEQASTSSKDFESGRLLLHISYMVHSDDHCTAMNNKQSNQYL